MKASSMNDSNVCDGGVRDLMPFRIMALYPPVRIDVDLYLPAKQDRIPRLYSAAVSPPSSADLDRLLQRGITTLFVPYDHAGHFREQLRELAASDVSMSPGVRLDLAREAVKEDFARAWSSRDPSSLISHAATFSQRVVDVCRNRDEMTSALASLAVHDGDTFSHISNVCTYAVMLARELGVVREEELLQVGQAALLHDIGKRLIRTDLLKKPGPLTPEEREVINEHPRLGFEELCHLPGLTRDQLLTVYQHHERLDGSGYPVRLLGDEINWMAQLCAVVDVFDALTARRSYRQAANAEYALDYVRLGSGKHYSPEYVQCWTHLVGNAVISQV